MGRRRDSSIKKEKQKETKKWDKQKAQNMVKIYLNIIIIINVNRLNSPVKTQSTILNKNPKFSNAIYKSDTPNKA